MTFCNNIVDIRGGYSLANLGARPRGTCGPSFPFASRPSLPLLVPNYSLFPFPLFPTLSFPFHSRPSTNNGQEVWGSAIAPQRVPDAKRILMQFVLKFANLLKFYPHAQNVHATFL